MIFTTSYEQILEKVKQVNPIQYASTRNYIDGAITYLSPYISRGVISTRQVYDSLIQQGYQANQIEKLVQELAWRDYWQQIWIARKAAIDQDLRQSQRIGQFQGIPSNIIQNQCGIEAIDQAIFSFYETGYLHNHIRMYLASICCNIAHCHWNIPARWMYYHLLDADWASNALSWQWVCGTNSHKLYYANQENINKYTHSKQVNTFLDVSYETLETMEIPASLKELTIPMLETPLPQTALPSIDSTLPTLIYNYYNLDPMWKKNIAANRILLIEPSVFQAYPVSQKSIDFCIALAKDNIPDIQVYVAEFNELQAITTVQTIHFKEHPLNRYTGIESPRTFLSSVNGDYPSFFAFWKKVKKELF